MLLFLCAYEETGRYLCKLPGELEEDTQLDDLYIVGFKEIRHI